MANHAKKAGRKKYFPDYARDSLFFLSAVFLALVAGRGQAISDGTIRVLLLVLAAAHLLSFLGRFIGVILEICSAASAARLSRLCSVFTLLPEAAFLAWIPSFLLTWNTELINRVALLIWINYFAVGCAVGLRRGVGDLVRSRKAKSHSD